mmetsp:Transcript_10332/g.25395  ORF Transcript_10332/g.25395 Transcript_10332/m.25395 type:complete len:211 (-) Transcript_10332:191-823(-)|eukprot:CAMPEP_0179000660 /NCGR_PEP_ID=MMETSP0795-20121207/10823_1 /TAXON_ID=88552 /ORGANISM="Amoebophrya sp., Strain Ameob2" /LENGTH=210 /DNA_ID=CAMNT_0020693737 /DNA_START=50 /DNA_END=682 /DNA_ORIENTATION=+
MADFDSILDDVLGPAASPAGNGLATGPTASNGPFTGFPGASPTANITAFTATSPKSGRHDAQLNAVPKSRTNEIFLPKKGTTGGLLEGTASLLDDVSTEVLSLDTASEIRKQSSPVPARKAGGGLEDVMMCRKCDFEVLAFADSFWAGRCDYLFFRNHFPQRDKLSQGLGRRPGKKALACQCRWAVIDASQHAREAGVSSWIVKRPFAGD